MERNLGRDERGAMMVIAVFMAIFLAGCLFYLIGVGDSAVYGERMQDASDSVAYVGAVYHARGMNVLVSINLIIGGLIAVLIALKLVLLLIHLGQIIAGVLCVIPWSAAVACPIEGVLSDLESTMSNLVNDYGKLVDSAVPALNGAQRAVASAVPAIALGESVAYANRFTPTVKGGAAVSKALMLSSLPVEKLPFDRVCMRANNMLETFVASLLPSGFGSIAGGMVSALVSSYPSYFCGDSTSSGARQQLDPKFCDKQEKKWQGDEERWEASCDKLGYGSDCPSDLSAQGGPKKPDEFDKGKCEDDYKAKGGNGNVDDGGKAQNTDSKSAEQIAQDAKNGGEMFAVYAAVLGNRAEATKNDRLVGIAAWGKQTASENQVAAITQQVALSKAEFYYEEAGDWDSYKDDALWNLKWRARLRRFRMPSATLFNVAKQVPGLGEAVAAIDGNELVSAVKTMAGKNGDLAGLLNGSRIDESSVFVH